MMALRAASGMLKFYLLGHFEVFRDGQPITAWGGRKTRDFVKFLGAAGGRPLSRDELVELLWTDPSPGAERDVKVLASRARRALGGDGHAAIVSTDSGYACGSGCWSDVQELEHLVAAGENWQKAGRSGLAEVSYARAIDLYRGPLLPEDLYVDWLATGRDRCRQLYIESLRALGGLLFDRKGAAVLTYAERLLAEDPFADTAIQALMLARAMVGDASAALAAYANFREHLLEELGASPSSETERLHLAILQDEPLDQWRWPAAQRAELRARSRAMQDQPLLVGRTREREILLTALESAVAGEAACVVLVGEPGIGKTRLLQLVRELAGERFHALQASGREREQHLPFQVIAEAIRSLDLGAAELTRIAGPHADALAELAPELRGLVAVVPERLLAEVTRRRILEGLLHVLRSLADEQPVLVVLDDLHWSDPSSIDTLLFCVRRLSRARVLWAIALRPGEPGRTLDELHKLPTAQILELGPLSTDDIRVLLDGVAEPVVDRVASESGGVPFYVLEVARNLAEGAPGSDLPDGIRRTIQDRIERLGPQARRQLEVASVLGGGFDLQTAAALADVPPEVALGGLEELIDRHLVIESAGASGAYDVAHHLIRRTAYQCLSTGRRRLLHGRVVDLRLVGDAAVVARHALEAGRLDSAAVLFRQAGDAVLTEHASREAEVLYSSALEAAHQARLGREVVVDLLDRLGRARAARGDYAPAAQAHRSALALAANERTAARQTVRLGWLAYYLHEPERAVELGRQAERRGDAETRGEGLLLQAKLAHADGQVERATGLVADAAQLVAGEAVPELRALEVAIANHRGHYGEALVRFETAANGLRQAGLLRPLASAMLHAAVALSARGAYARALTVLEESALQCQQAGAEHLEARVFNTFGGIYRQLGEPERADEFYARAHDHASRSGFLEALAHAWVGQTERALEDGDLSRAHALLESAQAVVHDPLVFYSWRIRMRWELVQGQLALRESRVDAALRAADCIMQMANATASPKYVVLARSLRAEVLGAREGGAAEARAALDLALQLDAPPLVCQAASLFGRLGSGGEAEHARHIARASVEGMVASLPAELGRALVSRVGPNR